MGKFELEIVYCVPCGHHGVATWLVGEFFKEYGSEAAIKVTPADNGRLEVYINGEKIFDRKEEGNIFPDLSHVKSLKNIINAKKQTLPVN